MLINTPSFLQWFVSSVEKHLSYKEVCSDVSHTNIVVIAIQLLTCSLFLHSIYKNTEKQCPLCQDVVGHSPDCTSYLCFSNSIIHQIFRIWRHLIWRRISPGRTILHGIFYLDPSATAEANTKKRRALVFLLLLLLVSSSTWRNSPVAGDLTTVMIFRIPILLGRNITILKKTVIVQLFFTNFRNVMKHPWSKNDCKSLMIKWFCFWTSTKGFLCTPGSLVVLIQIK